jgi:hypothetical protein
MCRNIRNLRDYLGIGVVDLKRNARPQRRDLLSPLRLLICLSSLICKNISVLCPAKSLHKRGHPAPVEGRIAIVTDVGAGCGGRGSARDEYADRGRRSRVVLTPRRRRQVGNDASALLVAMLRIALK